MRENRDGTIVLTDGEWNRSRFLHNGNYLLWGMELKLLKQLANGAKFEKVAEYNEEELRIIYKYEKALKDQDFKMRMRLKGLEAEEFGAEDGKGMLHRLFKEQSIPLENVNKLRKLGNVVSGNGTVDYVIELSGQDGFMEYYNYSLVGTDVEEVGEGYFVLNDVEVRHEGGWDSDSPINNYYKGKSFDYSMEYEKPLNSLEFFYEMVYGRAGDMFLKPPYSKYLGAEGGTQLKDKKYNYLVDSINRTLDNYFNTPQKERIMSQSAHNTLVDIRRQIAMSQLTLEERMKMDERDSLDSYESEGGEQYDYYTIERDYDEGYMNAREPTLKTNRLFDPLYYTQHMMMNDMSDRISTAFHPNAEVREQSGYGTIEKQRDAIFNGLKSWNEQMIEDLNGVKRSIDMELGDRKFEADEDEESYLRHRYGEPLENMSISRKTMAVADSLKDLTSLDMLYTVINNLPRKQANQLINRLYAGIREGWIRTKPFRDNVRLGAETFDAERYKPTPKEIRMFVRYLRVFWLRYEEGIYDQDEVLEKIEWALYHTGVLQEDEADYEFGAEDEPLFPGLNCSHCGSDEDTYYGEPLTHTPDGIALNPNDVEAKLHIWCDSCGEASSLDEEFGAESTQHPYANFRIQSAGFGSAGTYAIEYVEYNPYVEHRILLENPFDLLQTPLHRWMNRKKLKSGEYLTKQIAYRSPNEILFEVEFDNLTDALDWIISQVNNGRVFNDFQGEYPFNLNNQDFFERFGAEEFGAEESINPKDYIQVWILDEWGNSESPIYLNTYDLRFGEKGSTYFKALREKLDEGVKRGDYEGYKIRKILPSPATHDWADWLSYDRAYNDSYSYLIYIYGEKFLRGDADFPFVENKYTIEEGDKSFRVVSEIFEKPQKKITEPMDGLGSLFGAEDEYDGDDIEYLRVQFMELAYEQIYENQVVFVFDENHTYTYETMDELNFAIDRGELTPKMMSDFIKENDAEEFEAESERTFTVSKGPKRMYVVVEYNDGKELFLDGDGQKQFMEELTKAEATRDEILIEKLFGVGSDYHGIAEEVVEAEEFGAEQFLPNGVLRYYGKTVKEGQEGMFKGAEVKIIKIQEVKKHGMPSVIIYEYLDEEGNPLEIKGRFGMKTRDSTTVKDFMINFTPFEPVNPIEYGTEEFEAKGIDTFTEPFDELRTGSILNKAILLGSLGAGAMIGLKLRK